MKSLINFVLKVRGSLNQTGDFGYISKKEIGHSIPKVIHQTYHKKTLPQEISDNIVCLKRMNPNWEYRLYDDSDIKNYIQTHYPELLHVYLKINPVYGAAKADFFRYLLIYNEGGVYLDIKSSCDKPLDEVILADDVYILSHWQNEPGQVHQKMGFHSCINNPFGEYQQWHLIAAKGHPFLKAVIENVCNNIDSYNPFIHDTGGWSVVNATGPIAYTLAITSIQHLHPHRLIRNNAELGLIYSIYEREGLGMGHHVIQKKHYTLQNESLIILSFTTQLIFNIYKPLFKLAKTTLIKFRNKSTLIP